MAKIDGNCTKDTPSAPWIELPRDLTENILWRLSAVEILESALDVCTTWWRVCRDPAKWHVIDFGTYSFRNKGVHEIDRIYRKAVDCSQGQLIDVTFNGYCTDNLLKYVSQRSPNLKRLTLCCTQVRGKSLFAAVKKLPRLEELDLVLSYTDSIRTKHIEAVGNSCPTLKSFSYCAIWRQTDGNEYALSVAKSMPNLHHLRLIRLDMKNEGVLAVVKHCRRLVSLDLRLCRGTNLLDGAVGKKCSTRIKNLRRPDDSIDDYKWKDELLNDHGCCGCLVCDSDEDY